MTAIITSAPGKCILFGEHAVVYGHPAVAVAIDQRISIKIQPSASGMWLLDGGKLNMKRNPHIKGLIEKLWPVDQGAPPLSIHIEGNIPRSSGLGSSAALSVALAAALRGARGRWVTHAETVGQNRWAEGFGSLITASDAYGKSGGFFSTIEQDKMFLLTGEESVDTDEHAILAHSVEAAAQNGRASPIDSSTCSHGGVIVISNQVQNDLTYLYKRSLKMPDSERFWHIHELELGIVPDDIYLVIGNTGINAPTGKQVAKVAQMLELTPDRMEEIETIGKIAQRGIDALMVGDYEAVGRAMTENQIMLKSIGVSHPQLDVLIKAAAPTCLGAKLTGAGGGGCMVALTRNPKLTSDAIELAGGRTYISKLGSLGLRVEKLSDQTFWSRS